MDFITRRVRPIYVEFFGADVEFFHVYKQLNSLKQLNWLL